MRCPLLRSFLFCRVLGVAALAAFTLAVGHPSALAAVPPLVAIDVTPTDQRAPLDFQRPYFAFATFADGSNADVTASVAWSSSDPSVATISNAADSPAIAIGLYPGTTEIRAELDGVVGQAALVITDDRLVAIELSPVDPVLAPGASRNFVAVGHMASGDARNLTQGASWSSSDPAVATITNGAPAKGRATGIAIGTTEIRAQSGAIIGSTTLTIRTVPSSCLGGPFVCRAAGRTSLTIANRGDDRSDVLRFTWALGAATTPADFGNPAADTAYHVCVWDWIGGQPQLVMNMAAPPAGDCKGRPCWQSIDGGGFRYVNRSRLPDGLEEIIVRSGPLGKALVRVRGRGPALHDPPMPFAQDPKITLQVVNEAGRCWGADFVTPADVNTAQQLFVKERP